MRHTVASYLLGGLTTAFAISCDDAQAQKFQAEWIGETSVVTIATDEKAAPSLPAAALTMAFQGVDSTRAIHAQSLLRRGYDFYHQVLNAGGQYVLRNEMKTQQGVTALELTAEPDHIGLTMVSAHDSTSIYLKDDLKSPGRILAVETFRHIDIDDSTSIDMNERYALNGSVYTKTGTYLQVIENGALIATGSTQWDDKGGLSSKLELFEPKARRFHSYDQVADKPFGEVGTYQLFMDQMPSKAQSYLKKYVVVANNN